MKRKKNLISGRSCLVATALFFSILTTKTEAQEYAIGADLSFLESVNEIVLSTPDNLGAGVFWWEPATFGGRSTRDFFDNDGNVFPVITVFDKFTRH